MDEWVQVYAACWDGVVYCFFFVTMLPGQTLCDFVSVTRRRLMIQVRAPVQDVCTFKKVCVKKVCVCLLLQTYYMGPWFLSSRFGNPSRTQNRDRDSRVAGPASGACDLCDLCL
jgi:hypothetical protein